MVEQWSPKPLVRVQFFPALPYDGLVKLVNTCAFHAYIQGFKSPIRYHVGITQLVEFQSSKLAVAGSSPVSHSIFKINGVLVLMQKHMAQLLGQSH